MQQQIINIHYTLISALRICLIFDGRHTYLEPLVESGMPSVKNQTHITNLDFKRTAPEFQRTRVALGPANIRVEAYVKVSWARIISEFYPNIRSVS